MKNKTLLISLNLTEANSLSDFIIVLKLKDIFIRNKILEIMLNYGFTSIENYLYYNHEILTMAHYLNSEQITKLIAFNEIRSEHIDLFADVDNEIDFYLLNVLGDFYHYNNKVNYSQLNIDANVFNKNTLILCATFFDLP